MIKIGAIRKSDCATIWLRGNNKDAMIKLLKDRGFKEEEITVLEEI